MHYCTILCFHDLLLPTLVLDEHIIRRHDDHHTVVQAITHCVKYPPDYDTLLLQRGAQTYISHDDATAALPVLSLLRRLRSLLADRGVRQPAIIGRRGRSHPV